MKMIIAGGREYRITEEDWIWLDTLRPRLTAVVSGTCRGADKDGEAWADHHGIPIERYPANWKKYGRSRAGHIRNAEMAAVADAVVLFPGNHGTRSMYKAAIAAGITIYDRRNV